MQRSTAGLLALTKHQDDANAEPSLQNCATFGAADGNSKHSTARAGPGHMVHAQPQRRAAAPAGRSVQTVHPSVNSSAECAFERLKNSVCRKGNTEPGSAGMSGERQGFRLASALSAACRPTSCCRWQEVPMCSQRLPPLALRCFPAAPPRPTSTVTTPAAAHQLLAPRSL